MSELDLSYLQLTIDDTRKAATREYNFSVAHFQIAMITHNFICAKNDGREPTLFLVAGDQREVLNNRLEYDRAIRLQQSGGIVQPGPFAGF
jgi:hypothetical protein